MAIKWSVHFELASAPYSFLANKNNFKLRTYLKVALQLAGLDVFVVGLDSLSLDDL